MLTTPQAYGWDWGRVGVRPRLAVSLEDSASFMGQSLIVPSSCCSICGPVVVSKVSHRIRLPQHTALDKTPFRTFSRPASHSLTTLFPVTLPHWSLLENNVSLPTVQHGWVRQKPTRPKTAWEWTSLGTKEACVRGRGCVHVCVCVCNCVCALALVWGKCPNLLQQHCLLKVEQQSGQMMLFLCDSSALVTALCGSELKLCFFKLCLKLQRSLHHFL